MNILSIDELHTLAKQIRLKIIEIGHFNGIPHIGSSLSCVDILVTLYWRILHIDPHAPNASDRDRFILSKGHAGPAMLTTLAARGFFHDSLLETYGHPNSKLEEHPSYNCAPGVENCSGSLGHGLPIANGMAFASRITGQNFRCFVLMGDGECNEGSVWEAALFTASKCFGNVTVIVDHNQLQATGCCCDIIDMKPFANKWKSFGWEVKEVDGHDIVELEVALKEKRSNSIPLAIIANTVKGKGISFMENDNNWHYRLPSKDELILAAKELGLA